MFQESSLKFNSTDRQRNNLNPNQILNFHHGLSHSTNLQIICQICLQQQSPTVMYSFKCHHEFCKQCLLKYIKNCMNEFNKLQCCRQHCHVELTPQCSIWKYIEEQHHQWIRGLQQLLRHYSHDIQCQTCNNALSLQKKDGKKTLYCQTCKLEYCYNCHQKKHPNRCLQSKHNLPASCQQCNRCLKIVQKSKGCDHITCVCGHQFCHECGDQWTQMHICQYKIVYHRTCSSWAQLILKIVIMTPIILSIAIFCFLLTIFVCIFSSLFYGLYFWVKVNEYLLTKFYYKPQIVINQTSYQLQIKNNSQATMPGSKQNMPKREAKGKFAGKSLQEKHTEQNKEKQCSNQFFSKKEKRNTNREKNQPFKLQNPQQPCYPLLVFLLMILVIPLFWIAGILPGFFIPLINICYSDTVFLDHKTISGIWNILFGFLYSYIMQ